MSLEVLDVCDVPSRVGLLDVLDLPLRGFVHHTNVVGCPKVMPACADIKPDLYPVQGALVRCLRYATGEEAATSD